MYVYVHRKNVKRRINRKGPVNPVGLTCEERLDITLAKLQIFILSLVSLFHLLTEQKAILHLGFYLLLT